MSLESGLNTAVDGLEEASQDTTMTPGDKAKICHALNDIKDIACPGNRMPDLCARVTDLIEEFCD